MRIMFLCSTSTQVQTFEPIMRAFAAKGFAEQFIWVSLDPYYGWDAGRELINRGISYDSPRPINDPLPIRKLSIPILYWSLLTTIRNEVESFIQHNLPDVLIVGNDRGLVEKRFIHSAKMAGIRTVFMQDGLLWRNEIRKRGGSIYTKAGLKAYVQEAVRSVLLSLDMPYLAPTYIGEGGCDIVTVMGRATRNVLLSRGISSEKIHIVGQPRFEHISTVENDIFLKNIGGYENATQVVSVFTTGFSVNLRDQGLHMQQLAFVKRLITDFAESYPDKVHFLVKPHPREDSEQYAFVRDYSNVELITALSSIDVLRASNFVITTASTVISEAAILNKHLVVVRIGIDRQDSVSFLLGLEQNPLLEIEHDEPMTTIASIVLGDQSVFHSDYASELVIFDTTSASDRFVQVVMHR